MFQYRCTALLVSFILILSFAFAPPATVAQKNTESVDSLAFKKRVLEQRSHLQSLERKVKKGIDELYQLEVNEENEKKIFDTILKHNKNWTKVGQSFGTMRLVNRDDWVHGRIRVYAVPKNPFVFLIEVKSCKEKESPFLQVQKSRSYTSNKEVKWRDMDVKTITGLHVPQCTELALPEN